MMKNRAERAGVFLQGPPRVDTSLLAPFLQLEVLSMMTGQDPPVWAAEPDGQAGSDAALERAGGSGRATLAEGSDETAGHFDPPLSTKKVKVRKGVEIPAPDSLDGEK